MYKDHDGVFQTCMSTRAKTKLDRDLGPSISDLRLIEEMQEAEQTLENLLDHLSESERAIGEAEGILATILGAWTCVKRARAMVGC